MKIINLIEDWKLVRGVLPECDFEIPSEAQTISLPYDALVYAQRNFSLVGGEANSFYDTTVSGFYKELPSIKRFHRLYLAFEGVCGVCDVILNGVSIHTINNRARAFVDITPYYLTSGHNLLKLAITTYSDTGKYIGNGISGSVSLLCVDSPFFIAPNDFHIRTISVDPKANLEITALVKNEGSTASKISILAEVFNAKQKRVTKKLKKVKLMPFSQKLVQLFVKVSRPFEWSSYDPYIYNCKLSLADVETGNALESISSSFGIVRHEIINKSYRQNGRPQKIKGAIMPHENGVLGSQSLLASEKRRLSAIKEIGYNAVRFIGCPTENALKALDSLGLMCIVDLFDVWSQGRYASDGHLSFESDYKEIIESSVKALRNHPCVIMYNIVNNAPESYGRNNGYEIAERVVNEIKRHDSSKILCANAFELVPTPRELAEHEIKLSKHALDNGYAKGALIAGREKDLFKNLTMQFFEKVDVAGYSFLHPRFSTDRLISGRLLMGMQTKSDKMLDALDEMEKHIGVLGSFCESGADSLSNVPIFIDDAVATKPYVNANGDIDITGNRKSVSAYKEILLGRKGFSHMVVKNPDAIDEYESNYLEDVHSKWHWPRHVGKPIEVVVYSTGDIVALFLDGKQIGRKLAGKINNHMAVFKTSYYPGRLEAVSYHRGVEQSRVWLETVTAPKLIKLECDAKTIFVGDYTFINISVTDREGRVVHHAMRDITVTAEGEGEVCLVASADQRSIAAKNNQTCSVYDGRAIAVVKAINQGKVVVKVVSEGLVSCKATIKVK